MGDEFSMVLVRRVDCTDVEVAGELDVSTAGPVRIALADVHGPIEFDFRSLTFIDAAGLGAVEDVARCNGAIGIRGTDDWVRKVFEICDLTGWLR